MKNRENTESKTAASNRHSAFCLGFQNYGLENYSSGHLLNFSIKFFFEHSHAHFTVTFMPMAELSRYDRD